MGDGATSRAYDLVGQIERATNAVLRVNFRGLFTHGTHVAGSEIVRQISQKHMI